MSRLNLGPCCACGRKKKVRNILLLTQKAPIPGRGWGCLVCNLSEDGATAVVCDQCLQSKAPLLWACCGYPGKDGLVPIKDLAGYHEHDLSRHENQHQSHL